MMIYLVVLVLLVDVILIVSNKTPPYNVLGYSRGQVRFRFSRSLLLVLAKFSFWRGDWELGYNSKKF